MIGDRPLKSRIRRPPEELFDLDADPGEVNNLADSAEYAGTLTRFRTLMKDWQRATANP